MRAFRTSSAGSRISGASRATDDDLSSNQVKKPSARYRMLTPCSSSAILASSVRRSSRFCCASGPRSVSRYASVYRPWSYSASRESIGARRVSSSGSSRSSPMALNFIRRPARRRIRNTSSDRSLATLMQFAPRIVAVDVDQSISRAGVQQTSARCLEMRIQLPGSRKCLPIAVISFVGYAQCSSVPWGTAVDDHFQARR